MNKSPDPSAKLPADARAVLDFWFGPETAEAKIAATQAPIWWGGGPELDAEIRGRFGPLVEQAVAGGLESWSETPRGNLARVLLLDQLTRNCYRKQAEAFAGDPIARRLVLDALDRGDPDQLRYTERVFLYMPLEHAEDLALQMRCVSLFEALAADAPPELRKLLADYTGFAVKHRDIIARFGRFPHRNPILGRTHTPEEAAYLADGGATFGQG